MTDSILSGIAKARQFEPVLAVIDDKLALEALDDFLVVQEDKFRTGFECVVCDGLGHGTIICTKCKGTKQVKVDDICDNCLGARVVPDLFRPILETERTMSSKTKTCPTCSGTGKKDMKLEPGLYPCNACVVVIDVTGNRVAPCGFEPCKSCKGKSVTIVVPEESLRRPNSGIVRSIGPKVTHLKCGERVMYSNHTGYEIYFKRNLKMRQMREHEIMARIHGVGEIQKSLE